MKMKNIEYSKYPNNLISVLEQMKKDEENGFEMYHSVQFDLSYGNNRDYSEEIEKFNLCIKYLSQYYPKYYDLLMIRFRDLNEYDHVCELSFGELKRHNVVAYEKKAIKHLYQAYNDIDCIKNLSKDEDLTKKSMDYILLKFGASTKLINILTEFKIDTPFKLKYLYECGLISSIYTCGDNTIKAISDICKHIKISEDNKLGFPNNILFLCNIYDKMDIVDYEAVDSRLHKVMESCDINDMIIEASEESISMSISDKEKDTILGLIEPHFVQEFTELFVNGESVEFVSNKYQHSIYSIQCKMFKSILRIRKYIHTIGLR